MSNSLNSGGMLLEKDDSRIASKVLSWISDRLHMVRAGLEIAE